MQNVVRCFCCNTIFDNIPNGSRSAILNRPDEKLFGLIRTKPRGFGMPETVLQQSDKSVFYFGLNIFKTAFPARLSLATCRTGNETKTGVFAMENYEFSRRYSSCNFSAKKLRFDTLHRASATLRRFIEAITPVRVLKAALFVLILLTALVAGGGL